MDCSRFERWLDDGMPGDEASRGAAERHAVSCPACAAAAEAARSVEVLLAASPAATPPGFAGRVMVRVRAGERLRASVARIPPAPAMSWWIRALSDPAAAVTFTLGVLCLMIAGRSHALAGILSPLLRAASVLVASSLEGPGTGPVRPAVQAGIALGILPIAVLASFPLYRWSAGLFRRNACRMRLLAR